MGGNNRQRLATIKLNKNISKKQLQMTFIKTKKKFG